MVFSLTFFKGWLFIEEMKPFEGGGIWLLEDPLVRPYNWLRLFSVSLISLHVVLGFWRILLELMRNFEKPGFPIFVILGKGRPALRNSLLKLKVAACASFGIFA